MSDLIRELLPRLNRMAVGGDFVDERTLGDLIERLNGQPKEPTSLRQIRRSAQGESPTSFTSKIQLDRPQ